VKLIHAARTDVGMIRSGNEDNFTVDASATRGIFIVADGMGGHAAGEVASEMAVQIVQRELAGVKSLDGDDVVKLVSSALKRANRAIHDRTLTEVDKQGMGTTASVLLVSGSRYLIGQVGDSRVYLLRLLPAHEGPLLRAGAGGRRVPDAGAGALPSVQQRHHAVCRGGAGRGARHLPRRGAPR
jgi:serine/threonine protein phosphatase PrpC